MANAVKATETRSKTVEEKVSVVKLTLELDEAQAVLAVLKNVGGPHKSRRGKTDAVADAIARAGVYADGSIGVIGAVYLDDNAKADAFRSYLTAARIY